MNYKINTVIVMMIAAVLIIVFLPIDAVANTSGTVYDNLIDRDISTDTSKDEVTEDGSILENNKNSIIQSSAWLFLSALVKLVLATTIIILIIYYGAKFINARRKSFQTSQSMQTVAVHALGQNKNLQLIRIDKKIYVIGVGENVNLIKELSEEESTTLYQQFDNHGQDIEQSNSITNQFDSIFKKKIAEFKKRNESPQHYRQENEREFL
jgi:flagellar protein FliO/FliZ